MKNFFFLSTLAICLATSVSFADSSCQPFAGNYTVGPEGCFEAHDGGTYADYTYTGMTITAQSANDGLAMYYQEGSDNGYTVNYIADGQSHDGDFDNSGKTYTASCDAAGIQSTRLGMFIAPLVMSFTQNTDGTFTLTETITGADPFTRSCSMVRSI